MEIRTLDLFCGGGGSSWGAEAGGATIVGGIDASSLAVEAFSANFPRAKAFIATLSEGTDPRAFESVGRVDLLLASPECTNHTCARGNRPQDEGSRRTARYVLNFARHFQPRWIVIENVVTMRQWSGYDELMTEIARLGYGVRSQVIDAVDLGAPQTRRRLFLLCERNRTPGFVPIPLFRQSVAARTILASQGTYESKPLMSESRAAATIARAQRGIAALGSGKPFLLVYYGSDGSGGWQPLSRPLRTLTTLDRFGLVTWKRGQPMLRMLQPPELIRAMGFDRVGMGRDYVLDVGVRRDRIRVLGNGVCPPVMKAIVESLSMEAISEKVAA